MKRYGIVEQMCNWTDEYDYSIGEVPNGEYIKYEDVKGFIDVSELIRHLREELRVMAYSDRAELYGFEKAIKVVKEYE